MARRRGNALPKYRIGYGWGGGAKNTLYTWTDKFTGKWVVRPVYAMKWGGPNNDVRVATRQEAEHAEHGWQNPLHPGWIVRES